MKPMMIQISNANVDFLSEIIVPWEIFNEILAK